MGTGWVRYPRVTCYTYGILKSRTTQHPSFFLYSHVLGFFPRCRPPEWDSVQVILADLTPSEGSFVLEEVGYSRQCR